LIELFFYSALLFVLFPLLFLPPGQLLLEVCFPQTHPHFRLLSALGLGCLLYGALVSLGVVIGVPNNILAVCLFVFSVASASCWIVRGYWRLLLDRDVLFPALLIFLYGMLGLVGVAFPVGNLEHITGDTVLRLAGLPIDNILPYNFSRYVVERLNPTELQIVPTWEATDRGPLVGLLNGGLFIMAGLEERALWITTSSGLFFVFQALASWLNLLSIAALWFVALHLTNRRAAVFSLMLLFSTYFFYQNIIFTWPKFFAVFYVLTALGVWYSARQYVLAGILLGAGLLSHNSANFYIVSFLALLSVVHCYRYLRERQYGGSFYRELLKPLLAVVVPLIAVISPWLVFKNFFAPGSGRLFYMHILCKMTESVEVLNAKEEVLHYLNENSWGDLLYMRLENFIYPFAIGGTWKIFSDALPHVFLGLHWIYHLFFFKLILAVGVLTLVLAVIGLLNFRRAGTRKLLPFAIVCYGALVVAAALFGCPNWTSLHHWGYGGFLLTFLLAGWTVSFSRAWAAGLFVLSLATNLFLWVFLGYFERAIRVGFHVSGGYIAAQTVLLALIYLGCVIEWRKSLPEVVEDLDARR